MVGGWLLKILIGIAVVGFAIVELGSPLVARAQADDAAHEVANEAAFAVGRTGDVERLQQRCAEVAEDKKVEIVSCQYNNEGNIAVTVRKDAWSVLLDKWSITDNWYSVEVSATAEPR